VGGDLQLYILVTGEFHNTRRSRPISQSGNFSYCKPSEVPVYLLLHTPREFTSIMLPKTPAPLVDLSHTDLPAHSVTKITPSFPADSPCVCSCCANISEGVFETSAGTYKEKKANCEALIPCS
jgi:hypothetical protein